MGHTHTSGEIGIESPRCPEAHVISGEPQQPPHSQPPQKLLADYLHVTSESFFSARPGSNSQNSTYPPSSQYKIERFHTCTYKTVCEEWGFRIAIIPGPRDNMVVLSRKLSASHAQSSLARLVD